MMWFPWLLYAAYCCGWLLNTVTGGEDCARVGLIYRGYTCTLGFLLCFGFPIPKWQKILKLLMSWLYNTCLFEF